MAKKTAKQYVEEKLRIDLSKPLSDEDITKLAKFINSAIAVETPNIAKFDREDYDI